MIETTIKQFATLSGAELSDIEYMLAQKKLYIERYPEGFDALPDYKKILKTIKDLNAEQKKLDAANAKESARMKKEAAAIQKKMDNAKAKEEAQVDKIALKSAEKLQKKESHDELVSIYRKLICCNGIYHIASDNKIHVCFDDEWNTRSKDGHFTNQGITDVAQQIAYVDAMYAENRMKTKEVYSFNKQPDRVLNKMSRDGWLEPDIDGRGDRHDVFNIMLLAMSGGRIDIMDHIEQVIYWKYKHPEDYTIPCLSAYGVGGLGKNTFVKYVLGGIFGENQVITLSFDDIKDFSGLLVGKTFVFLDEMISDDNAARRLRLLCGNPTISINNKNGAQGTIESTAAWMTGGNDKMGSFLLDGSDADRRWSIIKSKTNVKHWTKELYELDGKEEVAQVMADNLEVLKDREEIAKWLGYICKKWEGMTMTPEAYHAEDYNHLLDLQKNAFDDFVESVFLKPEFEWIKSATLFKAYSLFIGEFYEGQKRWMKGRTKFFGEVKEWLEEHKPDIKKKKVRSIDGNENPRVHSYVAFDFNNKSKGVPNTDAIFVKYDKYGKEVLNVERFYSDEVVKDKGKLNILKFPESDF